MNYAASTQRSMRVPRASLRRRSEQYGETGLEGAVHGATPDAGEGRA